MTQRKDGLYQERLKINGKVKYFYGKTKKDVLAKIRSYKEETSNTELFEKVADQWWEDAYDELEFNTRKSYKPAYERAKQAFEGVSVGEITPMMLLRELRAMAKTYASKTVKNQLLIYRLIFRYAVTEGFIVQSPASDIVAPEGVKTTPVTAPYDDDIQAIKDNVIVDEFGLFPYFAMYSGLRCGELLALRWEDIDIEKRLISVNKSVYFDSNEAKIKLPKTKTSVGVVPILDALYNVLKPKKSGYVFGYSSTKMFTKSQFEKAWAGYKKRTGVSCTVHQLRHLFATMLFENNVHPEHAQRLLRHSHYSTTMNVYTHLRKSKQDEIFESVYGIDVS